MTINNYITGKLTFYKVVFPLFYWVFVVTIGDKLSFPMIFTFLLSLLEIKTMALGIVGLLSSLYLIFTGFYHYDTTRNYKWTIACTSGLISMLYMPVYSAVIHQSIFGFITIGLALVFAALVIWGSVLNLRSVKSAVVLNNDQDAMADSQPNLTD